MRRVECQCQVNFTTRRHDVGGEALVVLHVTGAGIGHFLTLELVKQLGRVLSENINQYVEATTMCHADHDFLGAVGTGALDNFVQHRNQ